MSKERVFLSLQKLIAAIAILFASAMLIAQLFHSNIFKEQWKCLLFNSLLVFVVCLCVFLLKYLRRRLKKKPSATNSAVNLPKSNPLFRALNFSKGFRLVLLSVLFFSIFSLFVISPFPVQSDEGVLLRTAHGGTDLIVNFTYVNVHNYQVFYMTIEHFVWKISHGHQLIALIILSLINVLSLLSILTALRSYIKKIHSEITDFSVNSVALIIGFIAAPATANIYPNLLFLALACFGLLCFQKMSESKSTKHCCLFSVAMFLLFSIAGAVRPNTAIFIAAIATFSILNLLKKQKTQQIFSKAFVITLIILSAFTSSLISDFCVSAFAHHYSLSKSYQLDPLSTSLATGLNVIKKTTPPGQYFAYTNPSYWANIPGVGIPPYSKEAAKEIKIKSWQIISENVDHMVKNPFEAATFFVEKFAGSNSIEDFDYYSAAIKNQPYLIGTHFIEEADLPLQSYLDSENPLVLSARGGAIFIIVNVLFKIFVLAILAFAIFGMLKFLKTRKATKYGIQDVAESAENSVGKDEDACTSHLPNLLLPITVFIGGEAYNLLSETKPAYILVWFIMLLPLAAFGVNSVEQERYQVKM